MLRRPSARIIKEKTTDNPTTNHDYAIIGDTASATLYAKRLLSNSITSNITLINEGIDRSNLDHINNPSFVIENNRKILQYLETEQIHLVPSNDNIDDTQIDQVIHYRVGSGQLGDLISSYTIPRVGPWFTCTSNRLHKFLMDSSLKVPLNVEETAVAISIKEAFGLTYTSSVIVKGPSILNCHYNFVEEKDDSQSRQLFLDNLRLNNQTHNVDYINETNNLKFSSGSTYGLHNVSGSNFSLENVKIIWKTNPYSALRISSMGGLNPLPLYIPTFYRYVGSIPLNNQVSGVNLTDTVESKDFITTHLTFSVEDLANPKSSTLTWLVQCYTTSEDLSVVDPAGRYADTGNTLLIVEGICLKNSRKASYNIPEKEIQINYNDSVIENGWVNQFAKIVSKVENSYTGVEKTMENLLTNVSVCTLGTCQDSMKIVDYSSRESPMVTILQMANQLYGINNYPTSVNY